MILDGHMHLLTDGKNNNNFVGQLNDAGICGGILCSLPPASFFVHGDLTCAKDRLDNLLSWTDDEPRLDPFFFIDPLEPDAIGQVEMAVKMGIKGFKIICDRFFPGDERAMKVYSAIADAGKPILFHSGILWDGRNSSRYNRPVEFEALLEISNLRFALAHISWPWCDELIAVYGKFLNAKTIRPDLSVEMFVDLAPGTPPIYRQETLTRLFTTGYPIQNNVFFGSDVDATHYDPHIPKEWIARDNEIYRGIGLDQEILTSIYERNLRRFVGESSHFYG